MIKLKVSTWFLLACTLNFLVIGCIRGMPQAEQPQAVSPEEKAREEASKIARLTIGTPKTTYKLGEAIPLELKLNVGKFDLLVPQDSVEAEKMISHLVVESAEGIKIECRKTIPPSKPKELKKEGKSVQGQPGIELKADTAISVSIENLLEYYPLTQAGVYTAQLNIVLPVYKETVVQKPDNILELEAEINAFQSDSRLSADKKQQAIVALREEISMLEEQGSRPQMFVILDSLRGNAELQSNVIKFTIQ
ncbi:hypothetical protein FJZ31_23220 [Candidatus Poribacteria bacterium]|nr:hypothetical protein [Candidatus Poribacteria bacterium]